jgi:hypothetical protein
MAPALDVLALPRSSPRLSGAFSPRCAHAAFRAPAHVHLRARERPSERVDNLAPSPFVGLWSHLARETRLLELA